MRLDVSGIDINLTFDEDALKSAIDSAMPVLENSTRDALRTSVTNSSGRSTGALVSSVGSSKCKNTNGGLYAGITFKGTDSKGVRNGLKAAQLEYGNSHQSARPFADRAANNANDKVAQIIENAGEKLLKVGE